MVESKPVLGHYSKLPSLSIICNKYIESNESTYQKKGRSKLISVCAEVKVESCSSRQT